MREILKLDALTKRVVRHLDHTKKAVKIAKAVTFSWTALTVIATVISLIPKYDKIEDIDTGELIRQCEPAVQEEETLPQIPAEI